MDGGYTDYAGRAFSTDADSQCGSDCGSGFGGCGDREKIEDIIDSILAFLGIESALGWNTEETDQQLARKHGMEPGRYRRVSSLLEKSIYGGIALEAYERRTLDLFVNRLWKSGEQKNRKDSLRRRYFILWLSFREQRKRRKASRKNGEAQRKNVICNES